MYTDKNSLQYFLDIQKKLKPTMSIEVGAFDADFSVEISKTNIPTYAFEGFTEIYDNFKDRLSNINYLNFAITDYDGTTDFYIDSTDPQWYLRQGYYGIKMGFFRKAHKVVSVPCTSLDSYFKDFSNEKIALWIDCEGANREVLEGAAKILSMVDSIYIEVEHNFIWSDIWLRDDVINYLDKFDFLLLDEFSANPGQTNCIFVKKHLAHLAYI
jgi:FkbM family methyltransferase